MAGSRLQNFKRGSPSRLLWILGLAVGIVAGGAVAVGIANSAGRTTIGGN
jgi:hypothetical protein